MQQVKSLEIAVLSLMEIDENRHDLPEGQPAGPLPFPFAAGQELAMPGGQEQPAEILDVAVQIF
jgi:hypothetical protein